MAMRFSVDPTTRAISRFDPRTNAWLASSAGEYRATRAREKSTALRAPGGIARPTPAKDISPPGSFQRGREAIISGIKKIPGVGGFLGGAADIIAPETPSGLAVDALLAAGTLIPPLAPVTGPALLARRAGTAAKVGRKLGKLVPGARGRAAVRIGAPPVAGGVTAGVTGGDVSRGITTGAGASVAELVGIPARAFSRFVKKAKLRGGIVKQGVEDARALGTQIAREVPIFKKFITGARGDLVTIRSREKGLKALKNQFQATDDAIKDAFKGDKISFTRTEVLVGKQTLKGKFTESLTAEKALSKLKTLKKEARKLNAEFSVREEARVFEEGFKKALAAKDPSGALLSQYDTAIREFSKGRDLLMILKESKAMEETAQGAFLNAGKLSEFLMSNIERFPPQRFPRVWSAATRGMGPGAADVVKDITFRGIVPRAGAANIRLFSVLDKAGRKRVGPGVGQLPVTAASARLFEMLSGSPTGR